MNRALFLTVPVLLTAIALPGCTNGVSGKRLAQLDYSSIAPLYVSAGSVEVNTTFVPSVDSSEAARSFTTTPDVALRRYAENRLKKGGYEGVLKFTIEDASVKHSVVQPDSKMMNWAKVGNEDKYDLSISVSLNLVTPDGRQPKQAGIQLNRFITVPQNYSIAKRETILNEFMKRLVEELDQMVTNTLQNRMQMAVSGSGQPMPMPGNDGPAVAPVPVMPVTPEALPPPW